MTDARELSIGAVFGERYQVVRRMSSGGMGAVYEVLHRETDRRCALKVMLPGVAPTAEMRARFRLEATVQSRVESDHIVQVLDAGVDPESGMPFMVMELLRGEEVGAMLERRGRLPPGEVVALLTQAALALDRTHAAGVVHRDLKPENLFVTYRDDATPHLKVLDFGVAKVVSAGVLAAKATSTVGTPLYMAPEQIHGQTIGPAADLYAMGHIAYAMLVGEAYWEEEARAQEAVLGLLHRLLSGAEEAATTRASRRGVMLPAAFDLWFALATHLVPERRFARAGVLVTALSDALGVARLRSSIPMVDAGATAPTMVSAPAAGPTSSPSPAPVPAATPSHTSTAAVASDRVTAAARTHPGRRIATFVTAIGALVAAGSFLALSRRSPLEAVPATASESLPPTTATTPPRAVAPIPTVEARGAEPETPPAHSSSARPAMPLPRSAPRAAPSAGRSGAPSAPGVPKHDPLSDP